VTPGETVMTALYDSQCWCASRMRRRLVPGCVWPLIPRVLNTLLLRIPGLAASPPVLYKLIKGKRVALPFFVFGRPDALRARGPSTGAAHAIHPIARFATVTRLSR